MTVWLAALNQVLQGHFLQEDYLIFQRILANTLSAGGLGKISELLTGQFKHHALLRSIDHCNTSLSSSPVKIFSETETGTPQSLLKS